MVTELTGSTKFGMDCVEGQVAGNDGMGRWALVTHVDTQIANELRRNPALQDMSFFTHMSNGSRIGQASLTSPSLLNSWRCRKKSANIRFWTIQLGKLLAQGPSCPREIFRSHSKTVGRDLNIPLHLMLGCSKSETF